MSIEEHSLNLLRVIKLNKELEAIENKLIELYEKIQDLELKFQEVEHRKFEASFNLGLTIKENLNNLKTIN